MRRLLSLALATGLAACSCDGGGTPPGDPPLRTATPVPAGTTRGVASFLQAVAGEDAIPDVFPGAANAWTLDRDFSLARPWAAQYGWDEGALDLWVGTIGTTTAAGILDEWVAGAGTALHDFPVDQTAAEVTWLTPLLGAADGVPVAAVRPGAADLPAPIFGAGSGYLAGSADSRLVARVALAPDQQFTFAWSDLVDLASFALRLGGAAAPPEGPRYQVVLRDPATGAALGDPLHVETTDRGGPMFSHSVGVSTAPGAIPPGPVDLSFELRTGAWGWASVDAVTVTTLGGGVPLPNGDFEATGLASWTAVAPPRSHQLRSAPRIVAVDPDGAATLAVTRTFFAPPAEPWARMVDVLRNDGPAPVTGSVLYLTRPAASPTSIQGYSLAAGGKAVVARDQTGLCRDLGIVFGSGFAAFDDVDPTVAPFLFIVHDVSVPAHGAVALVHFVVQLGQGSTGGEHTPAGTIAACESIAAKVRSDPRYLSDLEPGVLPLVRNL